MRFDGEVYPPRLLQHSMISSGASLIQIEVALEGSSRDVMFLIDTGADATVLHPRAARRILASGLDTIDFNTDSRRVGGLGVGGSADRVVRDATLALRDSSGETYSVEMPILVARPTPAEPGDHGNWRLPSLLGRDFLRYFRLELLCGDRREVALETL